MNESWHWAVVTRENVASKAKAMGQSTERRRGRRRGFGFGGGEERFSPHVFPLAAHLFDPGVQSSPAVLPSPLQTMI